ncbi:hypothetical protein N8903_01605 [Pelagibacterales bacterium]|nr:hypothetical protein [Pelagibacterales bacterium]
MKYFILKVFVVCIYLFSFQAAHAQKIKYLGQEISEMVKLTYESKVILPNGVWTVAGMTKSHGYPVWKSVSLVQNISNNIKALLIITYPRDPVINGWYKGSDDTCDDYEGQNSNYHSKKIKEKANAIMSGYCNSVYVESDVDASLWDSWDIMENTHNYIADNNLNYPPALIMLDSKYYSKINLLNIYYGYNPDFSSIDTTANINWKKSDWNKYNIEKHPRKNAFMKKIIAIQNDTIVLSLPGFKKRNPVDLSLYNFE